MPDFKSFKRAKRAYYIPATSNYIDKQLTRLRVTRRDGWAYFADRDKAHRFALNFGAWIEGVEDRL